MGDKSPIAGACTPTVRNCTTCVSRLGLATLSFDLCAKNYCLLDKPVATQRVVLAYLVCVFFLPTTIKHNYYLLTRLHCSHLQNRVNVH